MGFTSHYSALLSDVLPMTVMINEISVSSRSEYINKDNCIRCLAQYTVNSDMFDRHDAEEIVPPEHIGLHHRFRLFVHFN